MEPAAKHRTAPSPSQWRSAVRLVLGLVVAPADLEHELVAGRVAGGRDPGADATRQERPAELELPVGGDLRHGLWQSLQPLHPSRIVIVGDRIGELRRDADRTHTPSVAPGVGAPEGCVV